MLESPPILFLIFNRPDTTKKVFAAIRQAKPKKLFVAADGPRDGNEKDKMLCAETRRIVEQIDWDCELHSLFRDNNLGCKIAVKEALDWFFNQVDKGIILEDDCLPADSFFQFSEIMLNKYQNVREIKLISGTNHLFNQFDDKDSYFFSHVMPIWGWATWRRAWEEVSFLDTARQEALDINLIATYYHGHHNFAKWIEKMLADTFHAKIDAWSPYMLNSYIVSQGLNIIPYKNLVSNIGEIGTHEENQGAAFLSRPIREIDINHIVHPKKLVANKDMDMISMNNVVRILLDKQSLFSRVKRKFAKLVSRS